MYSQKMRSTLKLTQTEVTDMIMEAMLLHEKPKFTQNYENISLEIHEKRHI